MEHKIIVEYNEKYNFNKITCSEGCLMTTWKEGDDIKEYSASTLIYAPTSVDTSVYRCVTEEKHNELMELQRITIEEEKKKQREERVE